MKNITWACIIGAALVISNLLPVAVHADGNQGHHQSGITGRVAGGVILGTPTGEGSMVVPDHVLIYSATGELVAQVETEVQEHAWWYFEVYLKPGLYMVWAYAGSAPETGWFTDAVEVTVEKKQFTDGVVLSFGPS